MNEFFKWVSDLFRGMKPWFVVRPWELAVRIRLGKHVRLMEPGPHFRIPHIDEYVIVNTRLRAATTCLQTVTTTDKVAVSLAASIGFRVENPLEAFRKFQSPESTVSVYATTLLTQYVQRRDSKSLNIPELQNEVAEGVSAFFEPGITVDFVAITDFAAVKTYRLLNEQGRTGIYGGQPSVGSQGSTEY